MEKMNENEREQQVNPTTSSQEEEKVQEEAQEKEKEVKEEDVQAQEVESNNAEADVGRKPVGIIIGIVVAIVAIIAIIAMVATSLSKQNKGKEQQETTVASTVKEQETTTEKEEVVPEPISETSVESIPKSSNEPTPEPTKESKVAMVDWKTWATQPDNDEICLVVWNEQNGTQKILTSEEHYEVQEGDKLAVTARDNIMSVYIDQTSQEPNAEGYYDIVVEANDWIQISVTYLEGETDLYVDFYYLKKAN